MSNFNISFPNFYIYICLLIGLGFALLLYYKDERFKEHPAIYKYLLGFIRFAFLSFLCFLLLEPIIRIFDEKKEEPIIAVFQDVSSSITESIDIDPAQYAFNINNFCDILNTKYQLDRYNFGNSIESGIADSCMAKSTDLSKLFSFSEENYANQNLGAVIILSDGIYNKGRNPLYENFNISAPVFTVAIGDTSLQRDVLVKQVYYNKIAYLGDKQRIQVDIQAYNCAGQQTRLELFHKSGSSYRLMDSNNFIIDRSNFFQTFSFELDHNVPGNDVYQLRVSPAGNEQSEINNYKQIFIDVIDGKQKILLLANAPHPDIAALRRIFDTQKNFELILKYADEQFENPENYDLVIFHNLPSSRFPVNSVLKRCTDNSIPAFFFIGTQTNLSIFNQNQNVVNIVGSNRSLNEVQALVENDFSLFLTDGTISQKIPEFPPVFAPFGNYIPDQGAQILLRQKIGNINTEYPLLIYNNTGKKTGVFTAEGIWKWRLFDQLQNNSAQTCDQIILKSVQYLTLKEDKRKFRISSPEKVYPETESVQLSAELYNNVYERINEPDVFLQLSNEFGEQFNYTFSKKDKIYTLNLGFLSPGEYSYIGSTIYKGKEYTDTGDLTIQDIQLESYDLQANHSLLRAISSKYNGEFIPYDSLSELVQILTVDKTLKPVIYQNASTKPLTHLKWLFWILILLISTEWFIRRFLGHY